jgi:hypothetical protein
MARPKAPTLTASAPAQQPIQFEQVSGNTPPSLAGSIASSAAIYKHRKVSSNPQSDRRALAKPWQVEAYRQVNICGEARYAATLFASIAGRAEIGVSEPQTLARKAVWVTEGPEVDAFAELVPTVRERTKMIRDYMLHRVIAGECYLIARERVETDEGYKDPPEGYASWDDYIRDAGTSIDLLDPDLDPSEATPTNPNIENPLWEIVAVTEVRKTGDNRWEVRHDNETWLTLKSDDPVIRMWNPDPNNRREAWSPFRSLLPTLREIEWLTAHIFRQVRSRLMSAGVWFLPDNLTFPPPPPDAVEGGAETIAAMNEAEQFMMSLAASGMYELDADEVSFPTVVMSDAAALAEVDQAKLIKFWSEIDDKAMTLRSSAVRRFALGMDLPPEQILGSSGLAVDGAGGSAGSVNHWGVWANEEQTISAHVEPALDDFVGVLTYAYLRSVIPETLLVVGYDTASLRLRQDRSKEALEWYDRGGLKLEVALRETGFDPSSDMMDDREFRRWLLVKLASGSATPEMVNAALGLLNVDLGLAPEQVSGNPGIDSEPAPGTPGTGLPPSLDEHPYEGPPRVQHDQTEAPFTALMASGEALVLRALEKAGNRLLNDGKRGRDRDRTTPPHLAHLSVDRNKTYIGADFDFTLAPTVFGDLTAAQRAETERQLAQLCADLYNTGSPYTREALIEAFGGPRD